MGKETNQKIDTDNRKKGIVYILNNPKCFNKNWIKIGITGLKGLPQRIKDLSGTSVPFPFECLYACEVANHGTVEKMIHRYFNANHVSKEFYNISDYTEVVNALKNFKGFKPVNATQTKKTITAMIQEEQEEAIKDVKANQQNSTKNVPEGYDTYNNLKDTLTMEKNFVGGYFCIRLARTHKLAAMAIYEVNGKKYYSAKVFEQQAINEGILKGKPKYQHNPKQPELL